MRTLQNRIAVVTGGSRGIGRAIALELAADGVTLALVRRDHDKLGETAIEAQRLGAEAAIFVVDVTKKTRSAESNTRFASVLGVLTSWSIVPA